MTDTTSFADILADAAGKNQFLLLGDCDHRDGRLLGFAARPEHMQALAAQGVKHFFLEQPEVLEPAFRQYQDGQITRSELHEALERDGPVLVAGTFAMPLSKADREKRIEGMMQLLDHAKENGIRVHCIYNESGTEEMLRLQFEQGMFGQSVMRDMAASVMDPDMVRKFNDLTGGIVAGNADLKLHQELGTLLAAWAAQQPQSYRDEMAARYRHDVVPLQEAMVRARVDGDAVLAARMIDMAGGEKAVAFYGVAHGMHENDLDNHLPGSARILIVPNAKYAQFLRPGQNDLFDRTRQPDSRMPLGMWLMDEARFVPGTQQGINDFCTSGLVDVSRLSLCNPPEKAPLPAAKPAAEGRPGNGVSGP